MTSRPGLDVAANRARRPYGRRESLLRVLWSLAWPAFALSPRPFFGWRRLLLRVFGAQVGQAAHVYNSTRVALPWNLELGAWASLGEDVLVYNLGRVSVGARATVSLRAHLCAGSHDHERADMPLLRVPLHVGDDAWVCADAFVGPGVTVGRGAVVAARAVAVRDVDPWTVVAGNPARVVGRREIRGASRRSRPPVDAPPQGS